MVIGIAICRVACGWCQRKSEEVIYQKEEKKRTEEVKISSQGLYIDAGENGGIR